MNQAQNYVRLPLRNAYNVRDLGGYPCESGNSTKWHAFLRSDSLSKLEPDEVAFLKEYGVKTVIDLRSNDEYGAAPHPFEKEKGVTYHHIPLGIDDLGDITQAVSHFSQLDEDFIKGFYIEIVNRGGESVKRVMETIAVAPDGCILFHCTAGKDRTGILSMLLLGLVGVAYFDIVSNYEITYTYIREDLKKSEFLSNYPLALLHSKPQYIEAALDHILAVHGSVEKYLQSTGLSQKTLDLIKGKIK